MEKIITITYKAKDGYTFDDEKLCEKHETECAIRERAESALNARENLFEVYKILQPKSEIDELSPDEIEILKNVNKDLRFFDGHSKYAASFISSNSMTIQCPSLRYKKYLYLNAKDMVTQIRYTAKYIKEFYEQRIFLSPFERQGIMPGHTFKLGRFNITKYDQYQRVPLDGKILYNEEDNEFYYIVSVTTCKSDKDLKKLQCMIASQDTEPEPVIMELSIFTSNLLTP